jgi:hypothetical protein
MKLVVFAVSMRAVKARRFAQSSENSAKPASSRLCTGRCCGVNCFAIKHNGLLHKVRPVTALKLRLVSTPLRALAGSRNPRYVLRPLRPCGVRPVARQAVATSHTPDSHGQCACACGTGTGVSVRRFAQSLVCAPAHPVGLALARPGRAGAARPPPKGVPSTPAQGSAV